MDNYELNIEALKIDNPIIRIGLLELNRRFQKSETELSLNEYKKISKENIHYLKRVKWFDFKVCYRIDEHKNELGITEKSEEYKIIQNLMDEAMSVKWTVLEETQNGNVKHIFPYLVSGNYLYGNDRLHGIELTFNPNFIFNIIKTTELESYDAYINENIRILKQMLYEEYNTMEDNYWTYQSFGFEDSNFLNFLASLNFFEDQCLDEITKKVVCCGEMNLAKLHLMNVMYAAYEQGKKIK